MIRGYCQYLSKDEVVHYGMISSTKWIQLIHSLHKEEGYQFENWFCIKNHARNFLSKPFQFESKHCSVNRASDKRFLVLNQPNFSS